MEAIKQMEGGVVDNRPVYDMDTIKCFRCDHMGHFARNCPGLPRLEVPKDKGTADLNG